MARIAGLISGRFASEAAPRVSQMLGRVGLPAARATVESVATPGGALGTAGAVAGATAARGAVSVVFDGSIFAASGLQTVPASAAETFLQLHEQYGFQGACERINGDFAVALYDHGDRSLWLGRDRVGVKPLYYFQNGDFVAFASQPGSLLALPEVPRDVNRQFVALFAGSHYRTFDNDPHASPYAAISQLPAGHVVRLRPGTAARPTRYWNLAEAPDSTRSEQELAEEYRELLIDAVRLRLGVARKTGFLLSGGMDSSSVLASAVRATGRKQHAFSSVYEDRTYDESDEIRSMLDSSVEQWHPITIAPTDVFAVVDRMVRAHHEPVATATWLSHFLLCEEAATRGFEVLFGGLGGDELNAGEYEYFFFHFADIRLTGDEEKLRREVSTWVQHHDHPVFRKSMSVVEETLARVVDLAEPGLCRPDRRRLERYAATVNSEYFDVRGFNPAMDQPFRSYLKNRTYQDIFRETAPCCLRAEDRQTAAFGLNHFDPFFDYRLMEFMFRVPGSMKIRDGVTKILLREATRGLLPEATRTRIKKTGWNAPAHVWFSGRNLDFLRDMVGSRAFRERGIYDIAAVRAVLDEHEAILADPTPRENHMMFLWQLINLESWFRTLEQ
jgi:asparagine synthase (glutamine-hydrolysing)